MQGRHARDERHRRRPTKTTPRKIRANNEPDMTKTETPHDEMQTSSIFECTALADSCKLLPQAVLPEMLSPARFHGTADRSSETESRMTRSISQTEWEWEWERER